MENSPKILAVAGKGGVGKTSLSAVMVRELVRSHPDKKVLAIDADPAVGLSTALGVETDMTVDDIRKEIVLAAEEKNIKSAVELVGEARYRILDALVDKDGYSFLAIGRPEAAGCYCKVNAYLKEVIGMIADRFDYIVIDGEAGIEQINRRVMEKVTNLFLITDSSRKGVQVIKTILEVADELVMYEEAGAIINRYPYEDALAQMDLGDIPILAAIPADDQLTEFDLKGKNVFYLPDNSSIVLGARKALQEMHLIEGE